MLRFACEVKSLTIEGIPMKTYVLITHIPAGNVPSMLSGIAQLLENRITMLSDAGPNGIVHTLALVSDKDSVALAREISDFIHGANSFVLLEAGKDWSSVNLAPARSAWLYKNVNAQEYAGETRATSRG